MSGAFFDNGLKKFGLSRDWLPFKLFLNLRNMILSKADAFSAISPNITAELTSAGIHSKQIRIVPNSVDTDRFYPVTVERKRALREKLGLSQNAIIVIYVGRLVSYKGLPLLLEVWRELCQERKDACLLLVGTGGLDIHNCEAELRSFVEASDLAGVVQFTGNIENVPEYLQAADVFAFPTQDDALPSSLLEAMACALPVVTTPIGAIKTIVKDSQNGLLIQPGDFHQLYRALNQLMADTNLASELGQAALKTVQANFSTEVVTKQYLALFHQATKSTSAAMGSPLNLR
jgi:glycosyltransferase involved in cell wall biosynthesis